MKSSASLLQNYSCHLFSNSSVRALLKSLYFHIASPAGKQDINNESTLQCKSNPEKSMFTVEQFLWMRFPCLKSKSGSVQSSRNISHFCSDQCSITSPVKEQLWRVLVQRAAFRPQQALCWQNLLCKSQFKLLENRAAFDLWPALCLPDHLCEGSSDVLDATILFQRYWHTQKSCGKTTVLVRRRAGKCPIRIHWGESTTNRYTKINSTLLGTTNTRRIFTAAQNLSKRIRYSSLQIQTCAIKLECHTSKQCKYVEFHSGY